MASNNDGLPLAKPLLNNLCAIVRTARWYQLGIQLQLDQDMLNNIREDAALSSTEGKRTKMFETWLKSDHQATNKQLIEALQLKVIGEPVMASHYEDVLKTQHEKATAHTIIQQDDEETNSLVELSNEETPASTMQVMMGMKEKIHTIPELTVMALKLQEKYHEILAFLQSCCRKDGSTKIESVKNIIRSVLMEKSFKQLPHTIVQYKGEIDSLETVDDIFKFLVEKHFIGYLNHQLLKELSSKTFCGAESKKAKHKLAKYEKLYCKFIEEPQFCQLIQVFDDNPHLNPSTIVGLPIIIVSLTASWKHRAKKDINEWVPFLKENQLLLQTMGYKCILITYAIFPIDVPHVLKFLDDPDHIQVLKENGITIEVSTEAYEMAKLLPATQTSSQDDLLESRVVKLENDNRKLKEIVTQVIEKQKELEKQLLQKCKASKDQEEVEDDQEEISQEDDDQEEIVQEEDEDKNAREMEERRHRRIKASTRSRAKSLTTRKHDTPIHRRVASQKHQADRDSGIILSEHVDYP